MKLANFCFMTFPKYKNVSCLSTNHVKLFRFLNMIIRMVENEQDIEEDNKKESIQYIKEIRYGVNQ